MYKLCQYDSFCSNTNQHWNESFVCVTGTQYMHQLCVCAVNSIVSPFVLHDMALEAAHYLSPDNHYGTNGGMVMQHLRTTLTPLVHKCQQMWVRWQVHLVILDDLSVGRGVS